MGEPITITIVWRDRLEPDNFLVEPKTRDTLARIWQEMSSNAPPSAAIATPGSGDAIVFATCATAKEPARIVMLRLSDVQMFC